MDIKPHTNQTQSNTDLMARRAAAVPRGIGNAHAIFAERALNSEIWDVEGKRYIDFCAGIAVVNTGIAIQKLLAQLKNNWTILYTLAFKWSLTSLISPLQKD